MTAEIAVLAFIVLIAVGYLAQAAIWIMWPRRVEDQPDPLSDAPGDWPHLGGRDG